MAGGFPRIPIVVGPPRLVKKPAMAVAAAAPSPATLRSGGFPMPPPPFVVASPEPVVTLRPEDIVSDYGRGSSHARLVVDEDGNEVAGYTEVPVEEEAPIRTTKLAAPARPEPMFMHPKAPPSPASRFSPPPLRPASGAASATPRARPGFLPRPPKPADDTPVVVVHATELPTPPRAAGFSSRAGFRSSAPATPTPKPVEPPRLDLTRRIADNVPFCRTDEEVLAHRIEEARRLAERKAAETKKAAKPPKKILLPDDIPF